MSDSTQRHYLVRLRGHHLLCLFGYRGLGYDERFVAGMSEIVRRLRLPDTVVSIIAGPDDICSRCPRREKPGCDAIEHARDQAVLAALGLQVGSAELAATLFPAVAKKLPRGDLRLLCADCSWYSLGFCEQGVAAGRIAATWEER